MEELLAALKNYFDLIDDDSQDMDDWEGYLDSIEEAEQNLRSFLPNEEYGLPAFLTKGITK